MSERRKEQRHTINRAAKLQAGAGTLPHDCMIADMSETGARIFADGDVPDTFALLISDDAQTRRDCRVVWRLGREIGLEFTGQDRTAHPA